MYWNMSSDRYIELGISKSTQHTVVLSYKTILTSVIFKKIYVILRVIFSIFKFRDSEEIRTEAP